MTMSADCTKWCDACGQPERHPERPITVHGKITMCDACIAGLVDARNVARLERHYRAEWMTHGREHLVLHRSMELDGRPTATFVRDCAGIITGAETVGELLDVYTWLCGEERKGTFDVAGIGSQRNPMTPELLAVFRMLPSVQWRAADTVPLRVETHAVVCATSRELPWIEEVLRAELRQPIRVVRGLPSAIRERIDLLKLFTGGKSRHRAAAAAP